MNLPVIENSHACPPELKILDTEILVLGGGLPGVCAAIQAAEDGRKVILVERSLTLGGNCGPEVGVHPSDAHRFHTYMVSTGIVGKLIEEAAWRNAKTAAEDGAHYNISMQWDTIMNDALERAGVQVLLSHYAHTPYVEDDRITAVLCEDTLTYKRVLIRVSHFVIDDTGDGNIAERAGASYHMGRESKDEFGERMAPEKADSITMGSSLVSLIRNTGKESLFLPVDDTPPFFPGYGGDIRIRPGEDTSLHFLFPTETGGDIDTIEDGHEIYKRLRKHLDSAWDHVKHDVSKEHTRNWEMVWISPKIGKRESRRFEGDYWLTETDVENGVQFDDAIGVGGFALDIHDPKKENPEYVKITYYLIPPVYTIPYRCVYSKNINNLFFASRLLSASHLAHGTIRLQRTLAALAQAVGLAASMCTKYNITPRQLLSDGHLEEFQQRLLKEDCTIPNRYNCDENDLARMASVSASSEISYGVSGDVKFEKIRDVAGVELWDFGNHLDYAEFMLRNPGDTPVEVTCHLQRYANEHPWQYRDERPVFDYQILPNEAEWGSEWRLKYFHLITTTTAVVPPHFEGYVRFDLNAEFSPKNPLTDDDRLALTLTCDDTDIEIARCDRLFSYVRSIEGYCETPEGEKQYTVRPRSCFYRLSPCPLYGEAVQVLNGQNRRFSENPQNMWHPAELPADITLSWDEAICANEIRITFDTLRRTSRLMPYESGLRASPQCVKKFTVTLYSGDEVVFVHREDQWHNRLAKIAVPTVKADKLVVTVHETWDASEKPGIYEIRVY